MPLFVGTRHVRRYAPSSSSGGGATPTFVAAGTLAQSTTATNPTISVPYYSGLAANDIAIIHCGGYTESGEYTFPTISGWTLIDELSSSPTFGTTHQGLYWRRLDGGESGNVSVAFTSAANDIATGVMFGIRGCITSGTPYEDMDVISGAPGATTSMTSQSITTLGPNRLCLRVAMDEDAGSSSVPASWTQRYELIETALSAVTSTLDTIEQSSAGTVSASTRTQSFSGSFVIHTLAMIPT